MDGIIEAHMLRNFFLGAAHQVLHFHFNSTHTHTSGRPAADHSGTWPLIHLPQLLACWPTHVPALNSRLQSTADACKQTGRPIPAPDRGTRLHPPSSWRHTWHIPTRTSWLPLLLATMPLNMHKRTYILRNICCDPFSPFVGSDASDARDARDPINLWFNGWRYSLCLKKIVIYINFRTDY
jgi:hypothetical protein